MKQVCQKACSYDSWPWSSCRQSNEHSSDLEMISFTGSTRAIDIQKHAADNIKRVSLELGGKSPNLILDDVDLKLLLQWG